MDITRKALFALLAQVGAIVLLIVIMVVVLRSVHHDAITSELQFNFLIVLAGAILVAAAAGFYVGVCKPSARGILIMIWFMAISDVAILTLAVIQQGGLSRSIFVPIFFLIPTVVILLTHDDFKSMRLPVCVGCGFILLAPIVWGLYISSSISANAVSEYEIFHFQLKIVNIHDAVQKESVENALYWVSFYSLIVPVLEIIMLRQKENPETRAQAKSS